MPEYNPDDEDMQELDLRGGNGGGERRARAGAGAGECDTEEEDSDEEEVWVCFQFCMGLLGLGALVSSQFLDSRHPVSWGLPGAATAANRGVGSPRAGGPRP
jgi:hypothetical protein